MKVKLAGEEAGLESVTIVNQQLLLSYPTLPQGIKERGLPDVDPIARAGRNAYWVNIRNLGEEPWQDALLRILQKLKRV